MVNVAYVYPWDVVGDPAAAERIAALGVTTVALAASYHSTRAATPFHPAHRVLDVPPRRLLPSRTSRSLGAGSPPATPHLDHPPTRTSWPSRPCARPACACTPGPCSPTTPNSAPPSPTSSYATPSATLTRTRSARRPPDVAEYCERLVREVLVAGRPDGLILEGCGPMGFAHQGVHEKTSGAGYDPDLMSLCFCASCAPRYPTDTRTQVRNAIDTDTSAEVRPSLDTDTRPHAAALDTQAHAGTALHTPTALDTQAHVSTALHTPTDTRTHARTAVGTPHRTAAPRRPEEPRGRSPRPARGRGTGCPRGALGLPPPPPDHLRPRDRP
ncbi:hypothetical protein ACFSTC_43890 [Nonomuraea ferruginea]